MHVMQVCAQSLIISTPFLKLALKLALKLITGPVSYFMSPVTKISHTGYRDRQASSLFGVLGKNILSELTSTVRSVSMSAISVSGSSART